MQPQFHASTARGIRPMTPGPTDFDGNDSVLILQARPPANTNTSPRAMAQRDISEVAERLADPPARTWGEAADKARFLLKRYAASSDGQNARIRKLIGRALGDMTRLRKRHVDKT